MVVACKQERAKMPQIIPAKFEDITEENFKAYERVRRSGDYNMFDPRARNQSGLSREVFLGIQTHYSYLARKYPDANGVKLASY